MNNTFSDRLKKVRKELGNTQSAMAEELGIAIQTYNRYEKGKRIPDINFVNRVIEVSECDAGWLVSGEKESLANMDTAGLSMVREEQAAYSFTLTVHEEIARHNLSIIKRLVRKLMYIFLKDGDYRKTGAIISMVDALGPKDEEED